MAKNPCVLDLKTIFGLARIDDPTYVGNDPASGLRPIDQSKLFFPSSLAFFEVRSFWKKLRLARKVLRGQADVIVHDVNDW